MPLITEPTASPLDQVPTSFIAKTGNGSAGFTGWAGVNGFTVGSTTSASFVTLLNVTGPGVIEMISHGSNSQSSPNVSGARITIDGVEVYSFSGTPTLNKYYHVIGTAFYGSSSASTSTAMIPFYESLLIEGRGSGSVNGHVAWSYYLT